MHSLANCRQKAEAVRGRGPESVRRGSRDFTAVRTPEFIPSGQSKPTSISHKFHNQEDSCSGFRIEPPTVGRQNVNSHSSTAVHPSASWNKSTVSTRNNSELRTQRYHLPQTAADFSNNNNRMNDRVFIRDSNMVKKLLLFPRTLGYDKIKKKKKNSCPHFTKFFLSQVLNPSVVIMILYLIELHCTCVISGVCAEEKQDSLLWTIDASWGKHGRHT